MMKSMTLLVMSLSWLIMSSASAETLREKNASETIQQLCGDDETLEKYLNVRKTDIQYACRFLERSGDVRIYPEDGGACVHQYTNKYSEKTELALFHPSTIGALHFKPFGWQPAAELGKKQYNSIFDRIIGRYRPYAWETNKELHIQSTREGMASIFKLNKESMSATLKHFNPSIPDTSSDFTLVMSCVKISQPIEAGVASGAF